MQFFHRFILFFSLCFTLLFTLADVFAGQIPLPSFSAGNAAPMQPAENLTMDIADEEDMEEDFMNEGGEDDRPPLQVAMPPQAAPMVSQPPAQKMLTQPRGTPSRRPGFQQKKGMEAPEKIVAPSSDTMDEKGLDFLSDDGAPLPPPAAQLPPRDYPPRLKELQFGQTDWNQMDLHSIVEGRRS